jgi:hypothetical protein
MLVELTMEFLPGSKRMVSLSLPARIALLVSIFLVICVGTAFVAFYQTENRASWNYWVNPVRVTVIAVLLVVIPLVVYQVLRLWLTGVRSRFRTSTRLGGRPGGTATLRNRPVADSDLPGSGFGGRSPGERFSRVAAGSENPRPSPGAGRLALVCHGGRGLSGPDEHVLSQ